MGSELVSSLEVSGEDDEVVGGLERRRSVGCGVVVTGAGVCVGAGGFDASYFTGDSFFRNSRRLGSRLRSGSFDLSSPSDAEEPQNQPIVAIAVVVC